MAKFCINCGRKFTGGRGVMLCDNCKKKIYDKMMYDKGRLKKNKQLRQSKIEDV